MIRLLDLQLHSEMLTPGGVAWNSSKIDLIETTISVADVRFFESDGLQLLGNGSVFLL